METAEHIPASIRDAARKVVERGYDEGLVEAMERALLAERERAAKIAEAEATKAIGIYPPGEQRGIAVAVADYIRDAIRS